MTIRTARPLLLAALLVSNALPGFAAEAENQIAAPVLRASVNVSGDIVRVGDLIDNAGAAAQVAVYRAPDIGTTGLLPAAQVIAALRAHQVIGVDTRNIKEVAVTRLARSVSIKDIELAVAQAVEHRSGLGDAANISLSFDQAPQDLKFDAATSGALVPTAVRVDARSGRFDVAFEIAASPATSPVRLRFTGVAIETAEVAVLTRNIERNELVRAADVVMEKRPRAELGGAEPASREFAVGMQIRRAIRAGQALKVTDLAKPDLVLRDQTITVVYQTAGIYLTTQGKALENGADGDTVSVLNLQSKRTVFGRVTGRGQVSVEVFAPKAAQTAEAEIAAPVSVANRLPSSATPKAE